MRGSVSMRGLSKSYGDIPALHEVSLEVEPGEFLTLLGPSGCGKTTLLRLLGGFDVPDGGQVAISGEDMGGRPPYQRPVNTVFQHYALFPHRTVAGNVAFGLEAAGRPRGEIGERVTAALRMVQLEGLGARRIDQLSGGQKQRVALARAMVLEPQVLLLDEPLAALDPKLRKEMQREVKELHRRLGITFVFVTHDQEEALTMSDRVALMNQGRIEQVGTPFEVYERPRTRFVADFLAVRNLWRAAVEAVRGGEAVLRLPWGALSAEDDGGSTPGQEVWVGVRPERIQLAASGQPGIAGTLGDGLYLGDRTEWRVRIADHEVVVSEPIDRSRSRQPGDAVAVSIPPSAVLRLDDSAPAARP